MCLFLKAFTNCNLALHVSFCVLAYSSLCALSAHIDTDIMLLRMGTLL